MSSVNQSQSRGNSSQKKGGRKRNENNVIYANPLPITFSRVENRFTVTALGIFGISPARLLKPQCKGTFDPITRSVWITDPKDRAILWRRGFFGKGNLSRSEPSWLVRQTNIRTAVGRQTTSEEVTAKRRAERKQFKLDRARGIAAAAAEAESAFAEGRIISAEETKALIPSAATWKPSPSTQNVTLSFLEQYQGAADLDAEPLEDMEHMQLTFSEAFFLTWALDCLSIRRPNALEPMTLPEIWIAFQTTHLPPHLQAYSSQESILRPDNPFLLNYFFFHHYRSLGWVVKNGFAVVLIPVYEDARDAESSPFSLSNSEPFTWQWLSTINRVNSQVQKTLVLSYVTIPALSRVSLTELTSPACFERYSIREIIIRRFVPARMRD
ncbi:hypothetical protein B0F90DRAFT_1694575 [Multifurca ochricompacta]|uniref:tRNA-splicing endonuclease subunit Sen2 n=1 Tax=Multifurca ochricompacta TaxID=376703 RepID=A0AAD4QR23_9AGAM|nr:hypothetical protein B0F90DRAFT_1694575 [Multifurca ochricompacta]